jgi:TolB-like protein/Tfp pilus assembly protein PilF
MLAVLPFENLSADPAQEYFSDGLTEEMITQLGKLDPSRVGVIARTSAIQYKNTKKPVRTIGRELGVQYVLAGAVRRAANQVRITAHLSQVKDQTELWNGTYNRMVADVFAIQSDVAGKIAEALEVKLVPARKRELARAPTASATAHDAYLLGRYEWNRRTGEGFQRAIAHFNRAIAMDSTYAAAYSGLADSYWLLGSYRLAPKDEVLPKAKAAAEKALAIDGKLAEAHASLAAVEEEYERNWAEAEKHYKQAIALNPGYATAHQWYGGFLTLMGRAGDAARELERARELDPRSLIINADLGASLYYARRYAEAAERCRKALELDSTFAPAHNTLGLALWQSGAYQQAIPALQRAMALSGASPEDTAGLRRAYTTSGAQGLWRWKLDWLKETARQDKDFSRYEVATTYAALGDKDRAFEWLEFAYGNDPGELAGLKVDVMLDPLRSDPRYGALLEKLRLPRG